MKRLNNEKERNKDKSKTDFYQNIVFFQHLYLFLFAPN